MIQSCLRLPVCHLRFSELVAYTPIKAVSRLRGKTAYFRVILHYDEMMLQRPDALVPCAQLHSENSTVAIPNSLDKQAPAHYWRCLASPTKPPDSCPMYTACSLTRH